MSSPVFSLLRKGASASIKTGYGKRRRGLLRLPGLLAGLCLLAITPALAQAQTDNDAAEIVTTAVGDNLYMLAGRGGNIGLSIGDDGAFLIDDKFAPLSDTILAAVAELTDKPVRFVVNTHWHGDHTGGNANMAQQGAIVVAHHRVRERLAAGRPASGAMRAVPGASGPALPVLTFEDGVTFHWNNDTIVVRHVARSHTDGDSFVLFQGANVIHTGDVFITSGYPFVDTASGGRVQGFIDNARLLLELADADTVIIPGHGDLGSRADVEQFLAVLELAVARIGDLKESGMTLEQVQEASPMADYDERWGQGFMTPARFIAGVYNSL